MLLAGAAARQFGSLCIEPDHLLLRLLAEDALLNKRFIRPHSDWSIWARTPSAGFDARRELLYRQRGLNLAAIRQALALLPHNDRGFRYS
jgi:hypothetical protein